MSFTNTPASNSDRPADDQAAKEYWSEIMLPPQVSTFGGTGLQLFQHLQDWATRHHYDICQGFDNLKWPVFQALM